MFFRPIFPQRIPVGIEMRRNQTKIMSGSTAAANAERRHSSSMRMSAVEMMSAKPITKKPKRIGRSTSCLRMAGPPYRTFVKTTTKPPSGATASVRSASRVTRRVDSARSVASSAARGPSA